MILKAENLKFKYPKEDYVINNLSFSIEAGEVVGIFAPSGFGKTTLVKLLAGYLKPESGSITLNGQPIKTSGYYPIQLIFQHPEKAINPKWKMSKVLSESGIPVDKGLMDTMGIKEEWLNRWPSELSGGELQRFCLLRALTPETKFLIADEMTTMLDAITQAEIWNTALNFGKKHNLGILAISHHMELLNQFCHRIVNLD